MKDAPEKTESGAVGQPGETTTLKANNLTSAAISGLLNSEFAKDTAESRGQETPPRKEAETTSHTEHTDRQTAGGDEEQAEKELAERAKTAGKTVDEQREAEEQQAEQERLEAKAQESGKTVEEIQAEEAAEAEAKANELPAEMQQALDEWETKGGPLPDSLQRVVNKRIGRLTADKEAATRRAETAEAALKTLEAEAEALRSDPRRPAQPSPYGIPDEKELAKTTQAARRFLDEAEAYLDESATPQERERMERFMASNGLDANGLKRHVRQVNAYLRDDAPQARAQIADFRRQESAHTAQAERDFPWLKDANAPEQAVAKQMLNLLPDLPKRLPNHKLVLGIYMLGYRAYEAMLNKGAAGGAPADARGARALPVKAPPPKTPAGTAATRAGAATRTKPGEAASAAFQKAPTRENAVNLARAALSES